MFRLGDSAKIAHEAHRDRNFRIRDFMGSRLDYGPMPVPEIQSPRSQRLMVIMTGQNVAAAITIAPLVWWLTK